MFSVPLTPIQMFYAKPKYRYAMYILIYMQSKTQQFVRWYRYVIYNTM